MARVIDLSQPLSRESQLHPFFPPTQILRHIQHTDAAEGRPSFNAEIIITSNHAATHVDAFGHYEQDGAADRRDAARHVLRRGDLRRHPPVRTRPRRQRRRGRARPCRVAGRSSARATSSLFCSDHYNRTAGTPAFLDGFCGISAEAVHWMADRGVKIFGVETISPDLVYLTDEYPTHRACAERRLTHYENLNNLEEVVNRRFLFVGLPLRLEVAYGSPVRAAAIMEGLR